MSSTFAPNAWPTATVPSRDGNWRFAREVIADGDKALQWRLHRNCSIAPRQLGAVFAALCSLSLLIAAFFLVQGAPFVMAFAGLELFCVGLAFVLFARHAADHETLTLVGRSLQVQQSDGNRLDSTEFFADDLRIEPAAAQGSLVQISGHGKSVCVGRFVRPELRTELARELRRALRMAPAPFHLN
jgi:uncharacterized membrane protein